MEPSKQNIAIIASLVILVLLAGSYFWFSRGGKISEILPVLQKQDETPEEPGSLTRTEVPKDVKVPEQGEEVGDKNIAVPQTVAPSKADTQFRSFNIEGSGNKFVPSEVIVNQGDLIHINFKAVDKKYDFYIPDYGLRAVAEKGEMKVIEFGANTEGRYAYYCEICGGLNSSAIGYITVVKKY